MLFLCALRMIVEMCVCVCVCVCMYVRDCNVSTPNQNFATLCDRSLVVPLHQICKPSTVASEAEDLDGGGGVLYTAQYYDNMASTMAAHPPGSALSWITESA